MQDIEEKTVTREVEIKLTHTEKAQKYEQLGSLVGQIDEEVEAFGAVEAEFKAKKEVHKEKMAGLDSSKKVLEKVAKTGRETRMVECRKVTDFNLNSVQYFYGDELVAEEPLNPEDRQMPLLRAVSQVEDEELPIDEQIARDIKEQTNPATASSVI